MFELDDDFTMIEYMADELLDQYGETMPTFLFYGTDEIHEREYIMFMFMYAKVFELGMASDYDA